MTDLKIRIQLPLEHLNIRNCSESLVGHSFIVEDECAVWVIDSLFGGTSTSALFSIAVSTITPLQKFQLSNFTASFRVENYSLCQVQVQKFRLLGIRGEPIRNVTRKIREVLFCNNSKFICS